MRQVARHATDVIFLRARRATFETYTATGYVHEVTPEGDIVWSFANPEFDEEGRLNIWRMTRFSSDQLDFLGKPLED